MSRPPTTVEVMALDKLDMAALLELMPWQEIELLFRRAALSEIHRLDTKQRNMAAEAAGKEVANGNDSIAL